MKRALSFLSALIVTSALMAEGDVVDVNQAESMKETTKSRSELPVPMENHPPQRKVTPPIMPQVKDGSSTTAGVSFIWWKAYLNGLNFATSGTADTGNTYVPVGTNVAHGHVYRPAFSFEPGFKLNMDGPCMHDNWDIRFEYTWLGGNELTNSAQARSTSGINSLINVTTPTGAVTTFSAYSAHSNLTQQFNIADVDLSRPFFISQGLILRPYLGAKTAWIHEHVRFDYVMSPSANITVSSQNVVSASVIRKQDMWGLGIRTGLNGDWKIDRNFAFFGKFAASALWTDFHVQARDKTVTTGTVGITSNLHSTQSVIQVTPVLETSFGLSYVAWTPMESYRFMARASWEFQEWFDMNHMLLSNYGGNLTMQGFTIDFSVTF